jgi:aryl-alcohol dehydrogenase-like predicted oxidoreductase
MKTRVLGTMTGSAIGLGGMPMSIEGRPERSRSIATIHAALDAGITLIDTADAYHVGADEVGHNEILIAEAVSSYGGDTTNVLVATKGGHLRPGDGSWTIDSSPEHLRAACDASLARLGVEAIGLYQLHRPDVSGVPYEESVGVIGDLLDVGKIRMAGISNANPDQIRTAQDVLGGRLVSVQNQYSPAYRSSEPELRLCQELGIAFLPLVSSRGEFPGGRPRLEVCSVPGDRRRSRGQPPASRPGVDARGGACGHTDSGIITPGDRPGLGPVRRARPQRR